ncbi:MAG: hypothetical protein HN750_07795 [Gemmatimonadales bacterium]|jgi:hypothetical protein|nr:hypothetical protein [Gemmatimonadales bacterium]
MNQTWLTPAFVWVGAVAILGMNAIVPVQRRTIRDTTESLRRYVASGDSLFTDKTVTSIGASVGQERRRLETRWLTTQEHPEVLNRTLQVLFDELGVEVQATTAWAPVTLDKKAKRSRRSKQDSPPGEGKCSERRWFLRASLPALLTVIKDVQAWPHLLSVSRLDISPAPNGRVWVQFTLRRWTAADGPSLPPKTKPGEKGRS